MNLTQCKRPIHFEPNTAAQQKTFHNGFQEFVEEEEEESESVSGKGCLDPCPS